MSYRTFTGRETVTIRADADTTGWPLGKQACRGRQGAVCAGFESQTGFVNVIFPDGMLYSFSKSDLEDPAPALAPEPKPAERKFVDQCIRFETQDELDQLEAAFLAAGYKWFRGGKASAPTCKAITLCPDGGVCGITFGPEIPFAAGMALLGRPVEAKADPPAPRLEWRNARVEDIGKGYKCRARDFDYIEWSGEDSTWNLLGVNSRGGFTVHGVGWKYVQVLAPAEVAEPEAPPLASFKVGDKVRIVRELCDGKLGWSPQMTATISKCGTVTSVGYYGRNHIRVKTDDCEYYYLPASLELVTAQEPEAKPNHGECVGHASTPMESKPKRLLAEDCWIIVNDESELTLLEKAFRSRGYEWWKPLCREHALKFQVVALMSDGNAYGLNACGGSQISFVEGMAILGAPVESKPKRGILDKNHWVPIRSEDELAQLEKAFLSRGYEWSHPDCRQHALENKVVALLGSGTVHGNNAVRAPEIPFSDGMALLGATINEPAPAEAEDERPLSVGDWIDCPSGAGFVQAVQDDLALVNVAGDLRWVWKSSLKRAAVQPISCVVEPPPRIQGNWTVAPSVGVRHDDGELVTSAINNINESLFGPLIGAFSRSISSAKPQFSFRNFFRKVVPVKTGPTTSTTIERRVAKWLGRTLLLGITKPARFVVGSVWKGAVYSFYIATFGAAAWTMYHGWQYVKQVKVGLPQISFSSPVEEVE